MTLSEWLFSYFLPSPRLESCSRRLFFKRGVAGLPRASRETLVNSTVRLQDLRGEFLDLLERVVLGLHALLCRLERQTDADGVDALFRALSQVCR